MMPPGTSATPPANSRPAYEAGRQPMGAGGNQGIIELRKALGLPPDKPIPEDVLLQAATGRRGPQIKQLADRIGAGGTFKPNPNNPPTSMSDPGAHGSDDPNGVPSTPDPSQPGGQATPPNPNGPDLANGPKIMPGNNPSKLGSRTIFGRPSVGATGEQNPMQRSGNPAEDVDDHDEDDAPLNAAAMFNRR